MDIVTLAAKKDRAERITMLTAYDFPIASLLDAAGVDIILVGDSLANVALGLRSTTDIGMDVMLHHAAAVVRGVQQALIVADMPFDAYQLNPSGAVSEARRFLAIGCHAVKVEWFDRCPEVVTALHAAGIPVMGHVGLTPQTAAASGGFKIQGRDAASAARIVAQACQLEKQGCFAVVLECVPESLAQEITHKLKIPTIGIGAGKHCDGQVLVTQDMLGLTPKHPGFVKEFAQLSLVVKEAFRMYKEEVEQGIFPGPQQTSI